MTEDQMRLAIAEACGVVPVIDEYWVHSKSQHSLCMSGTEKECVDWLNSLPRESPYRKGDWEVIPHYKYPDYPADLNAIQTACLKTLGARERVEFCRWLDEVTEQPGSRQRSDYMASRCVLATARQRCEAFLRTIRKWKD